MPIYEYVCEADGERIELLRPMSQADAPVEDPKRKGRQFKRTQSTFAAQGAGSSSPGAAARGGSGGCCPCGKGAGACTRSA
jgi:putative FmdB family regulatory protein